MTYRRSPARSRAGDRERRTFLIALAFTTDSSTSSTVRPSRGRSSVALRVNSTRRATTSALIRVRTSTRRHRNSRTRLNEAIVGPFRPWSVGGKPSGALLAVPALAGGRYAGELSRRREGLRRASSNSAAIRKRDELSAHPAARPQHRPLRRRRHQRHVPGEDAARVARRGRAPARETLADDGLVDQEIESALVHVERDPVALLDRGDRAAYRRLGRDVAGHQATRRAAEAAVGQERDLLAQTLADQRRGDAQHLAHARAAARALVADDDHVARLDRAPGDGGHRVLLTLEDARGAAVGRALVPGHLHHAALGREVALQDDEAAGRLERPLERGDDLLPGRLDRARRLLRQGAAARRERAAVDEPGRDQPLRHHAGATRAAQVDGGEAPPGLQVRPQRRAARDR